MNEDQKDFINKVINPKLIEMAIDGSLPIDMNEMCYSHFEEEATAYNNTPEQKLKVRAKDAAHYLYESGGLSIGEQVKALEAQAKIDDMVGAESVEGVCVWEPFGEYAVKSMLKMF